MLVNCRPTKTDGAPCEVKVSRTVLSGGKSGDYLKGLPIAIHDHSRLYEQADGRGRAGDAVQSFSAILRAA
jgi:hypothetical protein